MSSMTPIERISALFNNRPLDRIPFIPFALGFTAMVTGHTIGQLYTDPQTSFRAQMLSSEMLGYDPLFPPFSSQFGAWEFGGEMRFPTGNEQSPAVTRHPVSTPDDIERLHIDDLRSAGNIPGMLTFARIARSQGLPAVYHAGAPFTRAGDIVGMDLLMTWIMTEPDLLHKVLLKVTDFLVNVGALFAQEFGAENVVAFIPAALESNDLISPKHFQQFALPYLMELNERLIKLGLKKHWVHICGNQEKNLPYWEQVQFSDACLLSIPEQIKLERAIEVFGNKAIIAGNIPPVGILRAKPEEVYESVNSAIATGKKAPRGYVVMPGCELPPMTPPINVFYMTKAVKDNGIIN